MRRPVGLEQVSETGRGQGSGRGGGLATCAPGGLELSL